MNFNIVRFENGLGKGFVSLRTPGRRRGSTGVAPLSLNLGTRLTWVVSFTPWPFKFQEQNAGIRWG
jgi:hypothetical protein